MLRNLESKLNENTQTSQQFVFDVLKFSSQYGKENSKSYAAVNLKSTPNHYPKYGDFLESCVLVS